MPRRLTNVLLLALAVALAATGLAGWILPLDAAAPLYVLHRALGVALVLAVGGKVGMARRSLARRLPRRDRSLAVGGLAAVLFAASVLVGFAWTLGAVSFDSFSGYSALAVHVLAGLALLAVAPLHLLARREPAPPLARALTRRSALRLGALSVAAVALTPAIDAAGAGRRITGSKAAGSFTGNAMPVTIWGLDAVPAIDAGSWRLAVGAASLSYADLLALPAREVRAVLDCTGGWWSEQRWGGVALADLLAVVHARPARVTARSVTGHEWTFDAPDVPGLLVATHLGGEPLSAAHGAPARLVAPGRRGFQWVKWLARIDLAAEAGRTPTRPSSAPG